MGDVKVGVPTVVPPRAPAAGQPFCGEGVGGRVGVLDHPHLDDHAARCLVVEVLGRPLSGAQQSLMVLCFTGAVTLSVAMWISAMRSGVNALERMSD